MNRIRIGNPYDIPYLAGYIALELRKNGRLDGSLYACLEHNEMHLVVTEELGAAGCPLRNNER